jgi:hypothetical protein
VSAPSAAVQAAKLAVIIVAEHLIFFVQWSIQRFLPDQPYV